MISNKQIMGGFFALVTGAALAIGGHVAWSRAQRPKPASMSDLADAYRKFDKGARQIEVIVPPMLGDMENRELLGKLEKMFSLVSRRVRAKCAMRDAPDKCDDVLSKGDEIAKTIARIKEDIKSGVSIASQPPSSEP